MNVASEGLGALAAFKRGERGAVAPILALSFVGLIGVTGTVLDLGRVMWVQRQLQSSADAAALAGAQYVATDSGVATSTATDYSGLSGKKNAVRGASSVAMVGGQPTLKCFASIKPACGGSGPTYNGIVVAQQAAVPTYFLRVVGIDAMIPRAIATASAKGGGGRAALDVMVVLDTTRSMTDPDTGCSIKGATKIQCAKAGATALLQGLNPTTDKVGFMVFPGVSKTGAQNISKCGSTALKDSDVVSYKTIGTNGATYQVAGLTDGFSSGGTLTATNPAVIAIGGGGTNCKGGIIPYGNQGTYFADAIAAGQAALTSDGRAKSQKVLVVLSDGDAGAAQDKMPTSPINKYPNQCQRAIAIAQTASAAGTWVYSMAYAAKISGGCAKDTSNFAPVNKKNISACETMRNIASDSKKFFSSGSGCNAAGGTNADLISLFRRISEDLTQPRLIPDNTV